MCQTIFNASAPEIHPEDAKQRKWVSTSPSPPLPRGLQNQDKTNLAEIGAICGYGLLTRYNLDKPK